MRLHGHTYSWRVRESKTKNKFEGDGTGNVLVTQPKWYQRPKDAGNRHVTNRGKDEVVLGASINPTEAHDARNAKLQQATRPHNPSDLPTLD